MKLKGHRYSSRLRLSQRGPNPGKILLSVDLNLSLKTLRIKKQPVRERLNQHVISVLLDQLNPVHTTRGISS